MNAKRPTTNSKNHASYGAGKPSAKSVEKPAGAQTKSKAPSPPPNTGVLVKRSF